MSGTHDFFPFTTLSHAELVPRLTLLSISLSIPQMIGII